jgi:DNA-binding MarR family transcriptional regulator
VSEPAATDNVVVFLSEKEVALARSLLSRLNQRPSQHSEGSTSSGPTYDLSDVAARIYRARRERRHFFSEDLFADPAWDMLLYLYCAEVVGQQLSASSLIHSAAVPHTTGLRWVQALARHSLVDRKRHPTDRRSVIVTLTQEGRARVERYLERAAERFFSSACVNAA